MQAFSRHRRIRSIGGFRRSVYTYSVYSCLKFEWDPEKRGLNLRKHGVTFENAISLFDKPYLEAPDCRPDIDEGRSSSMAKRVNQVIALVYTWRGERRRIISARKAAKNEREAYDQAIYSP